MKRQGAIATRDSGAGRALPAAARLRKDAIATRGAEQGGLCLPQRVGVWRIIPAQPEHIPTIAADMREADRREVMASHRHSPKEALECSLARSELAWTCLVSGVPAFMWGVARHGSMISEKGAPWLLGTPAIATVSRDFLRQSPAYVARMQERFPRLENFVHAENRLSIRWLHWCGFTIDDVPELIGGEDFFLFRRDA